MKTIIFILLILASLHSFAQKAEDLILLKNGNVVTCQIIDINHNSDSTIRYSIFENGSLRLKEISLKEVLKYDWMRPDQAAKEAKYFGIKDRSLIVPENGSSSFKTPDNLYFAGDELKKLSKHYYLGTSFILAGLAGQIFIIGSTAINDNDIKTVSYVSYGLMAAGSFICIEAIGHSFKAGKYLQLGISKNGIGAIYKIK